MRSHARNSRLAEVRNGLYWAGLLLLGLGWLCLVVISAGTALSDTRYPHIVGYLGLAVAALLAVFTMDKWVKVLPGLLGISIFNAIMVLANGYTGVDRSQQVPRPTAAALLIGLVVCSILANTLRSRGLDTVDRTALLGFLFSFGWAIARFPSLLGIGLMLSFLGIAWAHDRCGRHRRVHGVWPISRRRSVGTDLR